MPVSIQYAARSLHSSVVICQYLHKFLPFQPAEQKLVFIVHDHMLFLYAENMHQIQQITGAASCKRKAFEILLFSNFLYTYNFPASCEMSVNGSAPQYK